jgi:hypothetical protein
METNLFLLSARKKEYLANFQRLTVGYFSNVIYDLYDQVKKSNKVKKLLLKEFQTALVSISKWDDAKKEFKDYNVQLLEKLMNGIFKLDIVLRHELSKNAEKHIPCLNDFMYHCLLNIARLVWKNPVLVYDVGVDKITYQQNKLKLEKFIMVTVKDTFTYYLPFDLDDVEVEEKETEIEKTQEIEHIANLEDIQHEVNEEEVAMHSDEEVEDVKDEGDASAHDSDDDGDDECDEDDEDDEDYSDEDRGTDTPDDLSDITSDDSILDDIHEENDENEEDSGYDNNNETFDIDTGINEVEDNDDEPLTKQLEVDPHVSIPRYDNHVVDTEVQEVEQAIKHIYISEKPTTRDIPHDDIVLGANDGGDIKIVNIDEKGTALNLADKVHKKNSLLAIKKKVKSQVFVDKREQPRFGGASFF